jgi:DnaJ-class molecular chaperone
MAISMNLAFDQLNLPITATPTEIKDRWRDLASIHHPDRGGDTETFVSLKEAKDIALEYAARPQKCPDCHGAGKIRVQQGFAVMSMRCKTCKGERKVKYDG